MSKFNRLVDRFLTWELPAEVCADRCASVQGYPNRTGTNLLTADQARQMLRHVLGKNFDVDRYATEEEGEAFTDGYFTALEEADSAELLNTEGQRP
jgi:hypothetical protein